MIEFKDEILDTTSQPDEKPRYRIRNNNGDILNDDVQIDLKTPVQQQGTPLNAVNIKRAIRTAVGEGLVINGGEIKTCKVAEGGTVYQGDLVNLVYQPYASGKLLGFEVYTPVASLNVNYIYEVYSVEKDVVLMMYDKTDNTYGICVCKMNSSNKILEPLGAETATTSVYDVHPSYFAKCEDNLYVFISYGSSTSNFAARTLRIDENYNVILGTKTANSSFRGGILGSGRKLLVKASRQNYDAILQVNDDYTVTLTEANYENNYIKNTGWQLFKEDSAYYYYLTSSANQSNDASYLETYAMRKSDLALTRTSSYRLSQINNDFTHTGGIVMSSTKVLMIYGVNAGNTFYPVTLSSSGTISSVGAGTTFKTIHASANYNNFFLVPCVDNEFLMNVVDESNSSNSATKRIKVNTNNTITVLGDVQKVNTRHPATHFGPIGYDMVKNEGTSSYLKIVYQDNTDSNNTNKYIIKMFPTTRAVKSDVNENNSVSLNGCYGIAKQTGSSMQDIQVYVKGGVSV